MSKLHTLLLCPALAVAGLVLTGPAAAQAGMTDESASRSIGLPMTDPQNQDAAQHQQLDNKNTAASGDRQSASASNPSAVETKDRQNKKKEKSKAKPDASDQDEQFNKVLLGIYG
jgi:hypothetical protein